MLGIEHKSKYMVAKVGNTVCIPTQYACMSNFFNSALVVNFSFPACRYSWLEEKWVDKLDEETGGGAVGGYDHVA